MIAGLAILVFCQAAPAQLVRLRHWTGQSVAPAYEGFDTNPDGSFNMWFGYLNRNYEEEPDIPIGPANNFSPGLADRGQPTHFAARRHKDIFSVTVPKDFGDQKLTWTLTVHGQTTQVPGTLNPVWIIDRKYSTRRWLGWTILEVQDVDDKVGNGFTVVVQAEKEGVPNPDLAANVSKMHRLRRVVQHWWGQLTHAVR